MRRMLFATVLCLLLTGCVTTKLAEESRSQVRTVTIDRQVKGTEGPLVIGGSSLGAIGGFLAYKSGQRLVEYMKQYRADIGEILLEEFEKQVKEHPKFTDKQFIADAHNADATFQLEVLGYGLSQIHGLSAQYRPFLNVRARLVSSQGKKLWERYDNITAMNSSALSHTYGEYMGNPGYLIAGYKAVASRAVSLLMENL